MQWFFADPSVNGERGVYLQYGRISHKGFWRHPFHRAFHETVPNSCSLSSSSQAESCGSFVGSPAGLVRNLPTSRHNALALLAGVQAAQYKGISIWAGVQGHSQERQGRC